jgi:hypothetical protein
MPTTSNFCLPMGGGFALAMDPMHDFIPDPRTSEAPGLQGSCAAWLARHG